MKLVFATNNQHKLDEVRKISAQHNIEIVSLAEIDCHDDIPETADTLDGNALQKAQYIREKFGLDCFADDTGLEVEALNNAPGVYSARYGHKNSDAERIGYLLENLKDVPAGSRAAKFVCVITCLWPDGRKIVARGECPGEILFAPQGTGGFGYDPVFFLPELGKTYAELTPAEKNAISHRARALQAFCRIYREEFEHDDK